MPSPHQFVYQIGHSQRVPVHSLSGDELDSQRKPAAPTQTQGNLSRRKTKYVEQGRVAEVARSQHRLSMVGCGHRVGRVDQDPVSCQQGLKFLRQVSQTTGQDHVFIEAKTLRQSPPDPFEQTLKNDWQCVVAAAQDGHSQLPQATEALEHNEQSATLRGFLEGNQTGCSLSLVYD